MGKKIFIIFAENFCLSKLALETQESVFNLHVKRRKISQRVSSMKLMQL